MGCPGCRKALIGTGGDRNEKCRRRFEELFGEHGYEKFETAVDQGAWCEQQKADREGA